MTCGSGGGFTNTQQWADKVGRSTRQLLGLECGEPVGTGTIEMVASSLELEPWFLFEILAKPHEFEPQEFPPAKDDGLANRIGEELYEVVERISGSGEPQELDRAMAQLMEYVPDQELVNEIARRLGGTQQKAGEEHAGRSAPIGDDWTNAEVTEFQRHMRKETEPVPVAARKGRSTGMAKRKEQDKASETSQDPGGEE